MSVECEAGFHADDKIEKDSEKFFLENPELETDVTKDSKSCQPTWDKQFSLLRQKDQKNQIIDHYLQWQSKELSNYVKELDF